MKKTLLSALAALSFAWLPLAKAETAENEVNFDLDAPAADEASRHNDPYNPWEPRDPWNSRRCYGRMYGWSQVGYRYYCFIWESRWAWHLRQCEWNRVRVVPSYYCR